MRMSRLARWMLLLALRRTSRKDCPGLTTGRIGGEELRSRLSVDFTLNVVFFRCWGGINERRGPAGAGGMGREADSSASLRNDKQKSDGNDSAYGSDNGNSRRDPFSYLPL